MAVDLHSHSTASDGSDSPATLVRRAAEAGLTTLALTDHDTLDGIDDARAAADREGVELISGTELSLEWAAGGMHLVVLWLDPGPGPLQDRLEELREGRDGRNERIVERLNGMGIDIELAEVLEEAGEGTVGRPHIAEVMRRNGFVPDIKTAFDDFLAKGAPAYVDRPRLEPEEGIGLARRSGAVPILAHPHTLGVDGPAELDALLERLVDAGLVGIECLYGTYDTEERTSLLARASRHGLLPSGGSDYHGIYKPDIALGTGKVGLRVPLSILDDLAAAREDVT
jgi:predicted metal-dependent phosphoesterase TrpH